MAIFKACNGALSFDVGRYDKRSETSLLRRAGRAANFT
jgi:hypothetical protein